MGLLNQTPMRFLSMEVIDHQRDNYPEQLDTLHQAIIDKMEQGIYSSQRDISDSVEVKAIEELTFKRLGLRIRVKTTSYLAAVLPFYISRYHNLLPKSVQDTSDERAVVVKAVKEMEGRKGTVDLKKAKLGGIFSEGVVLIYMNYKSLWDDFKMSARIMTGLFLHEAGHAFNTFEFADRMATTNQVLAEAAKRIVSDRSSKTQEYVYRETSKVNPKIRREDVEAMMSEDRTIAGPAWARVYCGSINSQMNNAKYDNTTNEQLADNFAVRFGRGREVIEGLQKIGGKDSGLLNHPGVVAFGSIFITTVMAGYLGLLLSLAGMTGVGLLVFATGFVTSRIYWNSEEGRDYTYDDPKVRYERIRSQYIDAIRTSEMSDSEIKGVLESIAFVDEAIAATASSESVWRSIGNVIFRSSAAAARSIEDQQIMERLVNNNLYVHAARMKLN